jgi:TRAP-type C4-dicarboxylate transport system permease small subunit
MYRKMVQAFDSYVGKTSHVFAVIAAIQLVLMVFITTYGVVMRYFFRRPEPISYEICTIFLLWTFILAISAVERLNEHIRADIFIQYAPERIRNFLNNLIGPFLGLIFSVILTWQGWRVAMYSLKINEKSMSVWGEPLFPVKILIPICYGLMVLVLINKFYRNIASYLSKGGSGINR